MLIEKKDKKIKTRKKDLTNKNKNRKTKQTDKKHNINQIKLDIRELGVWPAKTEVKQGKFVEFISLAKGYTRETFKSQNINTISPTP